MKQPSFQFYTGDYKKDPELSMCSPATRGIWMDFLCTFHDSGVDRVSGTSRELSRLCRCLPDEMESAITELKRTNAADVEEQEGIFTIICRRLKKKSELSKLRANSAAKRKQSESRPEYEDEGEVLRVLQNYAEEIGMPRSDGEACYHKWQGNGWTNGGNAIRDWRMTMRSWRDYGYLPSQKAKQTDSKNGQKRDMSAFEIEKRCSAISQEINETFKRNGSKRVEGDGIDALKQRRDELKKQMVA